MTDRRRVFLSFGGGSPAYQRRVGIVCDQAQSVGYFTDCMGYDEYKLIAEYPDFWLKHQDFMRNPKNRRGLGFWLWKPFLILETLRKMDDNDILVYADAGCEVNPRGLDRLKEYEAMLDANEFGLLTFRLSDNCRDSKYTKRLTLTSLGSPALDGPTGQYMATIVIMRKTEHVVKYVQSWYDACCARDYAYLTGEPGPVEFAEYVDHRHDQSIHSLLVKSIMRNSGEVKPIEIPDETWYEEDEWETKGAKIPILARRHR